MFQKICMLLNLYDELCFILLFHFLFCLQYCVSFCLSSFKDYCQFQTFKCRFWSFSLKMCINCNVIGIKMVVTVLSKQMCIKETTVFRKWCPVAHYFSLRLHLKFWQCLVSEWERCCLSFRLGESEGSYCTLATFPSESSSSASSESSSPSSSPPATPLQDKSLKKVSRQPRYFLDGSQKHRIQSNTSVAALRVKPTPREVSFSVYLLRGLFTNTRFRLEANIWRAIDMCLIKRW